MTTVSYGDKLIPLSFPGRRAGDSQLLIHGMRPLVGNVPRQDSFLLFSSWPLSYSQTTESPGEHSDSAILRQSSPAP